MTKLVIATPTVTRPHPAYLAALEASVPALDGAGFDHSVVFEVGNAYISHARSTMLHKATQVGADVVMFIDHDVAWRPQDLLTVLQLPDDVVAGTYRFKEEPEKYMATVFCEDAGYPIVRPDGCIKAESVPAGFLKVTRRAVERFARAYPELLYGSPLTPYVDLFNHGAHKSTWWGEDYAFSRRWRECGGQIWLVPDLDLDHHNGECAYRGNFHKYMLSLPGAGARA